MPTLPPRSLFPRQRKTPTPPGEPVVAHACITQRQRRLIEAFGHLSVNSWTTHVGEQAQRWLDQGTVFSVPWPLARLSPALDLPQAILRFQLLGVAPLPMVAPIVHAWDGQRHGWDLAYWFTASNSLLPGHARPVDLLLHTPTLLVAVAQHDAHHQRMNQGLGPHGVMPASL